MDKVYTFKEAMDHLRVSRSTVYRLMESGDLVSHKCGKTYRFYAQELDNCIKKEGRQSRKQAAV